MKTKSLHDCICILTMCFDELCSFHFFAVHDSTIVYILIARDRLQEYVLHYVYRPRSRVYIYYCTVHHKPWFYIRNADYNDIASQCGQN